MSRQCKLCYSFAINDHLYGREKDVDLDLCDVCYWRKRAMKWIKINDKIPEKENKCVIIITNGADIGIVNVLEHFYSFEMSYFQETGKKRECVPVYLNQSTTHWMPLPELPKGIR